MRILITAVPHGEPDVERLALGGLTLDVLPHPPDCAPTEADLIAEVRRQPAPVLIHWYGLHFTPATLTALAEAGVRGIVCASVGYDHVDIAAARRSGITVCHVPDYGTDEVADHALSLLLWCRRVLYVAHPTAAAPAAWWDVQRFVGARRLQGATLALLGFGRIGQAVAYRAQAFGFAVRWYDPYVPRGQEKVTRTTRVESLAELLRDADALSIHALLNAETRGLVNAAKLALLPSHAVLVNTARGPLLEEYAVLNALRSGRLAAAALDVMAEEPPDGSELYAAYERGELPNLLLTPHVAWYSQESLIELRRKAAEEAGRLFRGETPNSPVP